MIDCEILKFLCRECSDPKCPELCDKYTGGAYSIFRDGVGPATDQVKRCADVIGVVVVGEKAMLASRLAKVVVDAAAWLAKRIHDLFFPDAKPGLLAKLEAPGEPVFDPLAALNAVIAAYLSTRFISVYAAYTPCPYMPDAVHNPLIVDGELPQDFHGSTLFHGGCRISKGVRVNGKPEPGTAIYHAGERSVIIHPRDGEVVSVPVGELRVKLGAPRR